MTMNNFFEILAVWYAENKRELPWRNQEDPYKIWISEIILQQTRIDQGWNYYLRFIERFPDVFSLANASEDEVLKYWQGLGYYSRARNLHQGAKFIVFTYNGIFPNEYDKIKQIKGIGDYTAAAIASFAFKLPFPAIDGNAYRVLARIFGVSTPIDTIQGKKEFKLLAERLIDKKQPDIFNQAIMDFGATWCKPKNPNCNYCPFENICFAQIHHLQDSLPVKEKKIQLKIRYFYYFNIIDNGFTYIHKRSAKDIWAGLYEFPLIECEQKYDISKIVELQYFKNYFLDSQFVIKKVFQPIKHQLTHQTIIAQFIEVEIINGNFSSQSQFLKIKKEDLSNYPISRLMELGVRD